MGEDPGQHTEEVEEVTEAAVCLNHVSSRQPTKCPHTRMKKSGSKD